jgi:hypothetical protein
MRVRETENKGDADRSTGCSFPPTSKELKGPPCLLLMTCVTSQILYVLAPGSSL